MSAPSLAFDVTVDDLVAFTVWRMESSPRYVSLQKELRLVFSGALGLICALFGWLLEQPIAIALALPFAVFYYLRYPSSSRRTLVRHGRRAYRCAVEESGVGRQTLALDGQVLEHKAGTDAVRIPMHAIEDIVRTPEAIYLVLMNVGIVIPRNGIRSGDLDAFIGEVTARRQPTTAGLTPIPHSSSRG